MVATNVNGDSSVSAASSPVTALLRCRELPALPGNVTVSLATLRWQSAGPRRPPTAAVPISGYTIAASPGGNQVELPRDDPQQQPGNLTNGTTYSLTSTPRTPAGPAQAPRPWRYPSAPSKATTVQEPQLSYDSWQPQTVTGCQRRDGPHDDTANSTASFVFTATGVTWLSRGGPTMGQAQVLIDGVSKGTVDLYRPTAQAVSQAYAGLKKVKHTITIDALGTPTPPPPTTSWPSTASRSARRRRRTAR